MFHLPNDVLRKIYVYDNTYKLQFNNVIDELNIRSLNHNHIDMSITREDIILFACISLIGLYIFIDEYFS